MEEEPHKRVLIVSHIFPPSPGIGGRRWAKFAKYLSRQGHHVEVLTADKKSKNKSSWTSDVAGIITHIYAHSYPEILERKPAGLFDKIKYRLALFQMKLKSKGSPYDRALGDKSAFLKELNRLLNSGNFDYCVVTGAPFNLMYYTSQLIPAYRKTFFIGDFRDPWTWGETFGYKFLIGKRLDSEEDAEKKVVHSFGYITSPWPEIVNVLKDKYPQNASKVELLPHGYDPDDLPESKKCKCARTGVKRLVYGGSIYPDIIPHLEELVSFVSDHSDTYQLDIYSRDYTDSGALVTGVHFHNPIDARDYFEILTHADLLLLLIPGSARDGVPSKLYELAALGIPIVALGRSGSLSQLVEEKKLGVFKADNEDMASFLARVPAGTPDRDWLKNHTIDYISRSFVEKLKTIAE